MPESLYGCPLMLPNITAEMKNTLLMLFLLLAAHASNAQRPENYPAPDQGPPEITFVNVLVYFVFPILIVALYILTRFNSARKRSRKLKE